MQSAAENQDLAEVQVIAPTLKSIVQDASVLNIARDRARKPLAGKSFRMNPPKRRGYQRKG